MPTARCACGRQAFSNNVPGARQLKPRQGQILLRFSFSSSSSSSVWKETPWRNATMTWPPQQWLVLAKKPTTPRRGAILVRSVFSLLPTTQLSSSSSLSLSLFYHPSCGYHASSVVCQKAEKEEKENDVNDNKNDKRAHPPKEVPPPPSSWIHVYLPESWRPYAQLARMDKPIGTWLLLWPCFWSTALAAASSASETAWPDPTLLLLFGTGAFVMRGAGCTINDMWDRNHDGFVQRTQSRPLPSGQLTLRQAWQFLALQLSVGLGILVSLPHAHTCLWWGVASLPGVVLYPLMKRVTNWPQAVLGLTINWGAFMGFAATHGTVDLRVAGPLYLGGVAWTMVYDTLYAHQDKVDDAALGLKSTALYFGNDNTKPVLVGFATLAASQWLLAVQPLGFYHPHYFWPSGVLYTSGIGLAYSHLLWQIATAQLDHADNLAQRFQSNQYVGAIVFASCVAGKVGLSQCLVV